MTHYRVILADRTFEDLDRHLDYFSEEKQSPEFASEWLQRMLYSLRDLKRYPNANPIAPENENSPYTIRAKIVDQCLFLFRVEEEHHVVRILRFRHGSQLPFDDME